MLQPLVQVMQGVLGHVGGVAFELFAAGPQALMDLRDSKLEESVVNDIIKWAQAVSDTKVVLQVYYFHAFCDAAQAMAALDLVRRGRLAAAKMKDRIIDDDMVSVMKGFRMKYAAFVAYCLKHPDKSLFPAQHDGDHHLRSLHGLVSSLCRVAQ